MDEFPFSLESKLLTSSREPLKVGQLFGTQSSSAIHCIKFSKSEGWITSGESISDDDFERLSMSHIFDPVALSCIWLLRVQKEKMKSAGFLDGLLYRPRHYLSLNLMNLISSQDPIQLSQALDFRIFFFYRKVIQEFNDNWICPKPLFHLSDCNNLPFYIPPFFLHAQRVSVSDLTSITNVLSYVGKATQDFYNSRNLQSWLLTLANAVNTQQPIPFDSGDSVAGDILGLPVWGWSRIVARFSSAHRKQSDLMSAIKTAAEIGEALAINSTELVSKIPDQLRPYHRVKNVYLLIGGKDMLALDWLPFVSRFLHGSMAQVSAGDSNVQCCYHSAFLLYEYPGYGFSSGFPSPTSCLNVAISSLHALMNTLKPKSTVNLVIVAYSLGCGVALNTANHILNYATKLRLSKIVLLAPPTSISACAANLLKIPKPFKTVAIKVLEKIQSQSINWDNVKSMELLAYNISRQLNSLTHIPYIHILNGARDSMVDPNMGETLYRTAIDSITTANLSPNTKNLLENITVRICSIIMFVSVSTPPKRYPCLYCCRSYLSG